MTTWLKFTIYDNPTPKTRARSKAGQRPYTVAKTRRWERTVGNEARAAMARAELPLFTGEVGVGLIFHRATGHRADLDNLCKSIFDGCNAIVWKDDALVEACTQLVMRKVGEEQALVTVIVMPKADWMERFGAMLYAL
jgi:Holliday junction resolvase RusA-like endonuclease